MTKRNISPENYANHRVRRALHKAVDSMSAPFLIDTTDNVGERLNSITTNMFKPSKRLFCGIYRSNGVECTLHYVAKNTEEPKNSFKRALCDLFGEPIPDKDIIHAYEVGRSYDHNTHNVYDIDLRKIN